MHSGGPGPAGMAQAAAIRRFQACENFDSLDGDDKNPGTGVVRGKTPDYISAESECCVDQLRTPDWLDETRL